ncbi:MAG: ferritin [Kiritimatiellae bacterium]|nr:ferritin [Kiritimatiellia bacterium]
MISRKMAASLNEQINRELYSSYLYLAMAAYCQAEGMSGMAKWLIAQSDEERGHAMKIYRYLEEQGARVALKAIAEPPAEFGSARQVFEETLKHERKVTAAIHALMEQAVREKDFATQGLLQWFVNEQVEEESIAAEIVAKLRMVGQDARGLYWIDRELGQRES